MYIFISHSSKDAREAAKLCAVLEENGSQCFLAPRDIRSGYEYAEEIINGIDRSDLMVLMLSKASNQSPHVLREVERAVSRSVPIIVYKLEEVCLIKSMEYFLMTHQWLNAQSSGEYTQLAECVKEREGKASEAAGPGRNGDFDKIRKFPFHWGRTAVIFLLLAVLAGMAIVIPRFISDTTPELGEEITFGRYNNAPIVWRVLNISEDGSDAVLISRDILTMKAYDAPESGKYNYDGDINYWTKNSAADKDLEIQERVRGSSQWENSTIRTWLNSDQEVVKYQGQAPVSTAMSNGQNGYHNEPGFIHEFTEEEKGRIQETEISTGTNGLSEEKVNVTTDKVYLLARDELVWFDRAGMSVLAEPAGTAVEQDETKWYQTYSQELGVATFYWWLRNPVETSSSRCYMVSNGYGEDRITSENAGMEGFGIRPALTLKLK